MKDWKKRDRTLARTAAGHYPADVRAHPTNGALEIIGLHMGTDKEPHLYVRVKLPLAAIARGRRATLPWRRLR